MAISENTKRKILFVVLAILAIGLVFLLWLISSQIKSAEGQVGEVDSVSATASASRADSVNVSVTYSLTASDENTDLVKDVANKFMQTKEDRSFEDAKAFMTSDLQAKWSQDTFAPEGGPLGAGAPPAGGAPSMDRFEVTDVSKLSDTAYSVSVTSYWPLNGQAAQTVKYSLELTKKDSDFLVSKFDQA